MLKKSGYLIQILVAAAMLAASVTLIKSLFYDFSNDTVPLFSIIISVFISLICVTADAAMIVFSVRVIRASEGKRKLLYAAGAFLAELVFAGVCCLVHSEHMALIAAFFLTASLLLILSLTMQLKD